MCSIATVANAKYEPFSRKVSDPINTASTAQIAPPINIPIKGEIPS